ncbi:NAD(P)-dependent dehydrogenase, short-chain alcohol dehydrogenase family [Singulisphaera sp. GP187]|uniref:oxidoreductase n=1 Tax=Singulisphaera sp. GP187 TaxID=1882752 RepID=UPI000928A84A|nr:oxidoreductase [Singulisphaera sp. GP187]SIO16526.1 NAD(P)-dependent dehydrogenase, short-chain alcohol dehydrogenase family [Singulisphaera sp. GP187]
MTTQQKPIPSKFGFISTAEEVLGGQDLSGKTVIVTGGYAGLGLETTRVLSEAGATVIVPARSAERARANLAGLPRVELGALDLLNPESIDAFAEGFLASGRPLDLLINNAGIMACPLARDSRGNESQFSANHLGHFQLTLRLWPALIHAGGARVISLTSRGHRFSEVVFDDPNFDRRPYDKWKAYGQSKTANALFAMGLDRRGEAQGVRAFSVHPGGILTDLTRHLTMDDLKGFSLSRQPDGSLLQDPGSDRRFKDIPKGAATTIWCATSPQLDGMGGVYCEDCDIAEVIQGDMTVQTGMAPYACDLELAEKLWTLSEALTCVRI